MMELTKYDLDMFMNLETLTVASGWYNVRQDRNDLDRFIEAIKKRIYHHNDFEFNGSYTKFRRIEIFKAPIFTEITHSIQWREDTGQQTEKELNLEPKPRHVDKKQWDKLKGRAT